MLIFIEVTGAGVAPSTLDESRQKLDLPILLVYHHIVHGVASWGVPPSGHYEGVLHLYTTTPTTKAQFSHSESLILTPHGGIGKIPARPSRGAISRDDSCLVGQKGHGTKTVEATEEQDITSHTRRRPAEVC